MAQLRGLRELHAAGALTDEEFAAAKARVIGATGLRSPPPGSNRKPPDYKSGALPG